MQTLPCVQGDLFWHEARAKHFTASEAPAMMGASKYMTRSELLKQKATGFVAEVDAHKQALFDKGHATEAAARPLVEAIIGEQLYPVVGLDDSGTLLASFDGLTMGEDIGYEHKLWNEDLARQVIAGELEPHYYWQLEQQLLVSGAKEIIFVTSDGTKENFEYMRYKPRLLGREALLAGWEQFRKDLEGYVPAEAIAAPVAKPIEDLPALIVQIEGRVVTSNLAAFRNTASEFIQRINTDLQTDQDFVDAEKMITFCADGEKRLEMVKAQALAQTASIDELFRTMDSIAAELRAKRLELNRTVTARKESIRSEILNAGIAALSAHIAALNTRLTKPYMPTIAADFAGKMKGKKTVASLRDAVDTELSRAKIVANDIADKIQINLNTMRELAAAHAFLFSDTGTLVLKSNDDLVLLIKSRIAEHAAAEAQKLETERERIRLEEVAKLADKARQEQVAQNAQQNIPEIIPAVAKAVPSLGPAPTSKPSIPSTPPSLRLGQIGERLGFDVTADFLRTLGFEHAAKDRSAVLYHEHDFVRICAALVDHINNVSQLQAA